ncbi:hypothetical protein [Agrobacterium larrymoorei]|uniref:Uncharacterized protein n=1 Tax=Agrobacterium larrymoorei TaxID=160699 RepID=A0A4D7DTP4_9HYPH|nr:hypothetical protein [Agrobacterium larrymoorei]QCJ00816.1 hypothetical protein CFBP5473_22830 [Agrobacterium larrymoorei]QYA10480.1 hypothetical protein J5285_25080 [Agrobacterium larrymoorei]WHA43967.1 hypothetical protein CFBP5477_022885 [Agrobacterium larrymoorei]
MKEIELAGWVLLPIGKTTMSIDYVNWQNRSWLVPAWVDVADKGIRLPTRLIAPRFVSGHTPPPGPETLEIFKRLRLPEIVFDANHSLDQLVPLIEIVERPALFMRSIHALVA